MVDEAVKAKLDNKVCALQSRRPRSLAFGISPVTEPG
jgi:hypothetical protein